MTTLLAALAMLSVLFPSPLAAQDHALLVSIDRYADPRLSGLPQGMAETQIDSISKLLIEKHGYKREHIKVLRNDQATKSAILSAFESWLGPADDAKEDRLKGLDESGALDKKGKAKKNTKITSSPRKTYQSFFYFSGYGFTQKDSDGDEADALDETLVPYDAKVESARIPGRISGMISDDELSKVLAGFTYRDLTVVLDTSHSGHVTRSSNLAGKDITRSLAPPFAGAVSRLARGEALERHKSDGPFLAMKIPHGSLTVWSAASPTQTALVVGTDDAPRGLFTLLYVEGLGEGKADANANGIVSNAELLRHVSDGSASYCLVYNKRCEMGLQPRLDPIRAYGEAAWVDRKKVTHARERRLTLKRLSDFLANGKSESIEIQQSPAAPVHVGARDIRFRIRSPMSGYLVLLNLTDKGELFQIYPNQFSGSDGNGHAGPLQANSSLEVPGDSDVVKFSATVPAKGQIIAVMTPDPVVFGTPVTHRTISSVTQDEAIGVYLAALSGALNHPMNMHSIQVNTGSARWFVNTRPYEILP